MKKAVLFFTLLVLFTAYSFWVYSKGSKPSLLLTQHQRLEIRKGKKLFQEYNCVACHQVYGLGGYLGPDLTNAWSDKRRGEAYLRAMLASGGARMPNFHFSPDQIEAILSYLKYVDTTTAQDAQRTAK